MLIAHYSAHFLRLTLIITQSIAPLSNIPKVTAPKNRRNRTRSTDIQSGQSPSVPLVASPCSLIVTFSAAVALIFLPLSMPALQYTLGTIKLSNTIATPSKYHHLLLNRQRRLLQVVPGLKPPSPLPDRPSSLLPLSSSLELSSRTLSSCRSSGESRIVNI